MKRSPVLRFDLAPGCLLRPVEEGDADELHALIERNRAQLARWIRWAQDQTPQDTVEFIRRARAKAADENSRSRAVAERLGFSYEGTLRQAYWLGDRYRDDAVYSLLAGDRAWTRR